MGPFATIPTPAEAQQLAADRQDARVEAAIRAGWVIRHDPERLEYRASRELLTARTLDDLLSRIEGADGGL